MALPATDAFTGITFGTGLTTYSANWTVVTATGNFIGSVAGGSIVPASSGATDTIIRWNADSFNGDHYAQCIINTGGSVAAAGPAARVGTGGDAYVLYVYGDGTTAMEINKFIGGSYVSTLATAAAPVSGSLMRIEASGSTIRVLDDGVQVMSVTDSSITGGGGGLACYTSDTGGPTLDLWEAGNLGGSGSYTLTADSGLYNLTGQTSNLRVGRNPLVADKGDYALTGFAATLSYNAARTLPAETGYYTLIGSNALVDLSMNADKGDYTLTGFAANLLYTQINAYTLTAAQGAYSLNGQAAGMFMNRTMAANQGQYNLAGFSAGLNWSGAPVIAGGYKCIGLTIAPRLRI